MSRDPLCRFLYPHDTQAYLTADAVRPLFRVKYDRGEEQDLTIEQMRDSVGEPPAGSGGELHGVGLLGEQVARRAAGGRGGSHAVQVSGHVLHDGWG